MKVFIQRVTKAEVRVDSELVGRLTGSRGYLLLCGIAADDTPKKLSEMAKKIATLRIFINEKGRFDHSILDVEGAVLAIPQFTLFADTSKGRRPEFFAAMKPPQAEEMFDNFCKELAVAGISKIEKGIFGADMQVELINDGPVSIMLEN